MGQIHVDGMSVDILCSNLRYLRGKTVVEWAKMCCKNRPEGGTRRGPCEK